MLIDQVATFYTMYNREPVAPNFLQLCTTTPCQLGGCGSTKILHTIQDHLGIKPGQSTKDGKFTLIEVECLGACSNAPSEYCSIVDHALSVGAFADQTVMQVGDDFYEDLTPESTVKILDAMAKGEKPKPGPQSGRRTSENSAGLTSLLGKVSRIFVLTDECSDADFSALWARRALSSRICIAVVDTTTLPMYELAQESCGVPRGHRCPRSPL
jgi:NADH dehydrogenase (ubiquinone) flavoprotein 2